jgi:hypothetical protein
MRYPAPMIRSSRPSNQEMPMSEAETSKAVQLLDLMLKFFTDDKHWIRDHYHDGSGRHCLVGAVRHFSSRHRLPEARVMSLLEAALPQRQLGLILFNDYHCGSVAELRSVILKARALALENAEHERAAESLKRRLLAEIEREQAARGAAGDTRERYILCPRAPTRQQSHRSVPPPRPLPMVRPAAAFEMLGQSGQ